MATEARQEMPTPDEPPVRAVTADEGRELTFTEHLHELRKRIVNIVIALAVAAMISFLFAEELFHALMVPVLNALPEGNQALVYTSAVEKFFVYLRVAIYAGIFLAAPVLLHQIWRFVAPGLYESERKLVLPFIFFGSIMFVGGGVFCYFVVLPNAFDFLINFGGASDWTQPMLTLKEQLSLVLMMELAFGVVFEIPLIIAFMALIGLVDADLLSQFRRHAVVICTIIAAVLTPTGDPFNLALMAVPMYIFYELGIIISRVIGSRRQEREEALASLSEVGLVERAEDEGEER